MISRHMEATADEFRKPEEPQSESSEREDLPPTESE